MAEKVPLGMVSKLGVKTPPNAPNFLGGGSSETSVAGGSVMAGEPPDTCFWLAWFPCAVLQLFICTFLGFQVRPKELYGKPGGSTTEKTAAKMPAATGQSQDLDKKIIGDVAL
jgi:hypothetical protein